MLGHELNNSLAPIQSIACTLVSLLTREPRPDDWKEDMQRGLEVIGNRSEALIRFMAAYARLARLPPPRLAPFELASLIRRIAALETRLPVYVEHGPEVTIEADADQIEQLLINLIRNAVDAALLTGGGVGVGWRADGAQRRGEGRGRGAGPVEHREPLRPLLHHQAGRDRHRPRPLPADRRGPRRHPHPGEPHPRAGVRALLRLPV